MGAALAPVGGLWAVGGAQGTDASVGVRDHGSLYVAGVLAEVDPRGGRARSVLRYTGPGGWGDCFKGVAAQGAGELLVCTEAEVLTVRDGRALRRISLPSFNDLHHARRIGGVLHVASTGCDGVVVGGHFVPVGSEVEPPVGDVRSQDRRPHALHPNHLFEVDGRAFVTRGMVGDAVSLDGAIRWPIAEVVVHDGLVAHDGVWFTTVDGRLVRVDPAAGRVDRTVDLNALDDRAPPLGWCRGLARTGDLMWVGFTRLRATAMRQRLAWVAGTLRGRQVASSHPTRIVGYDLAAGRKVAEIELASAGMDAVFGLVGAPTVG